MFSHLSFQGCNHAYRETFNFAVIQARVQGMLGDLSGVHGRVKRDSGEFHRALGKLIKLERFLSYICCLRLRLEFEI